MEEELKTNPLLLTILKVLNDKPKSWKAVKEETKNNYTSILLRTLDTLIEYKLAEEVKEGYIITPMAKKVLSKYNLI